MPTNPPSDDEEDRTQRLVAELAEVRRRMSRRAMPALRAPGDSGSRAPLSVVESLALSATGPRPALQRSPTERVILEEAQTPTTPSTPPSRGAPQK